jgi:hypothetical protein
MENNQLDFDPRVFASMQSGAPYATYRKTILGKVYVTVLSPFTNKPEGILLEGEPKEDSRAIIDVWSEMEDLYFKRQNKKHFQEGTIIRVEREPVQELHTIEQYSDNELKEVINYRYITFNKTLNEITTAPVLMRMLDLSREMEKSERIVKAIEARLSAIQLNG